MVDNESSEDFSELTNDTDDNYEVIMNLGKHIKTYATLAILLATTQGHTQESYIGFSYGSNDYEENGASLDLDTINLTIGSELSEQVSAEFRVGVGINNEDLGIADISVDTLIGAYARINFSNDQQITPYFIAGVTQVELEVDTPTFGSATEDETDVSYGLGADFELSNNTILNLEYMQYLDKDGAEVGGLNLGVYTRF